jgi:Fanconi anemia group M protein
MYAGSMSPAERAVAWEVKRVFFLTPQVLTNDLTCGQCPAAGIKCVVVDEAHKALGNHSYCQVSINAHTHYASACKEQVPISG